MSDTNKEREAFEAWYASKCSSAPKLFGRYQDPEDPSAWLYLERAVDDAWFVWQGARASTPHPETPAPLRGSCAVNMYSSRMCERGVKGCVTQHAAPVPQSAAISDEQIMHLWDTRSGFPTEKYPLTESDVLAFARAVLALAPGLSGWQEIASAPKDGSLILLGDVLDEQEGEGGIVAPGYWQKGYEDGVDYMGCDDGFVDVLMSHFGPGRSFGSESHRYKPTQPTHWMPLPTPPKEQE